MKDIDRFISILADELESMNLSSSVLYNQDWWNKDDRDEFLKHLKDRITAK